MNPMIKKLVDTEFMSEAHGIYLEEALLRKESIIVSGHKGWGILPLMATLSSVAKMNYSIKQVKCLEDISDEVDYLIVADSKGLEFSKLVAEAMAVPNTQMIAIKDPDHPYSFFKVLGDVFKATGDTSKVYQVIECAKIDNEKKLHKITCVSQDENGKAIKNDF